MIAASPRIVLLFADHLGEGSPAKLCAFYAGGHVADAFELGRFVEVFFLVLGELLALHHLHEQAAQTARFLDRLARDQVGHHVGRRLADSAAMAP